MIESAGPVEAALSSQGFKMFWARTIDEMVAYRNQLREEAEAKILEGNSDMATAKLLHASVMSDVINKLRTTPTSAIKKEKSSNERPVIHRYDAI